MYGHLPRVRFIHQPTPLEQLTRIGIDLGHQELYVKRDDAMALGFGGNKLRSLELWVGAALEQQCDTLLVAGALDSNQCRLTAAAAAKVGLHCIVLHSADRPDRLEGNAMLSSLYGADLCYLGPVNEAERSRAVEDYARQLRRSGRNPYIVGDPVLGAIGYVIAAEELLDQSSQMGIEFDHIILPGSMGPTEAGLLYGLLQNGFSGQVHLISVEFDAFELKKRVTTILNGIECVLGELSVDSAQVARYDDSFLGPGYGVATVESRQAMRRFATTEAVLLESTYTAKPFAAMLSLLENGIIGVGAPVCAYHTGGLPNIFCASE